MLRESMINQARKLRFQGKTYTEIVNEIGKFIPKSTLSKWCEDIVLPRSYKNRVAQINHSSLIKARRIAELKLKEKRQKYFNAIDKRLKPMLKDITDSHLKLMLAMLYLGEGSKTKKGSLTLGNSDTVIIKLFLKLLRKLYKIDESKFRCTVQCRADQNVSELENYWSLITGIPKDKFYKAQIDKRSIGKPTLRANYKGVLRIDYFSAEIFWEIDRLIKLLNMGL